MNAMLDINKYIQSQYTLAKQRCVSKGRLNSSQDAVSEKSKSVSELISIKQDKKIKCKSINESDTILRKTSCNTTVPARDREIDTDSEYLPSEEEDDETKISIMPLSYGKNIYKKNKIIDDGNTELYNLRVEKWRNDLATAISGQFQGAPSSADVNYILKGQLDHYQNHELQNGFNMPNYIWKQLYKYQKSGVKWLWELHQIQSGGLLGDEMGLGKTVQIIAFLVGLSKTDDGIWGGLGPSLIVAPATVIYQWVTHFHYWSPYLRVAVLHHSGSFPGNHNQLIKEIQASHGILLITYAGIARYTKDLLHLRWHYIILDEGHKIRNPDTQVSKLVKKFKTPHKLLITGSPMQNSLQELWSLFDFMRPGLLGTYKAFLDYFATPITQGGYANASPIQEATALEIAKTLKNLITPYMLRRTKAEVQEYVKLPDKNEQVLFCALSTEQKDLYMGYLMSNTVRSILDKECKFGDPIRARVLVALSTLRKICNHPDLYLYEAQEADEQIDYENFGHWKRSGKMIVVHSLLKIWQKQSHRALVFSQSRVMICILEQHLQIHNLKYIKMDGTVSVSQRQSLIKTFNENEDYLVFLATTRVGGLGLNLTGADRVIIYDPDWNPATDSQAKERAWRIGQKRNVTVYRLLSAGTIEEKIYQRQIFKHFLSNKILIDPNQKNVLTTSTLQGLFSFDEPNCEGDTETPNLFKHTKVKIWNKIRNKEKNKDKGNEQINNKVDEMRRRAKEISDKISRDNKIMQKLEEQEDPRERYRKKRQQLCNPPVVEEPKLNLIDGSITDEPFENVISELDIINLHVKIDYEKNILEEALSKPNKVHSEIPNTLAKDNSLKIDNEIEINDQKTSEHIIKTNTCDIYGQEKGLLVSPDIALNIHSRYTGKIHKSSTKRKNNIEGDVEIDNVLAIKKVKKKKHNSNRIKDNNDDDYVLSKLFAKSSVRNALQHDEVVGLAEKEKRHRMKEEAIKKAKEALRAVKFSYKN